MADQPILHREDNLTKVGSFIPALLGILNPILTGYDNRGTTRERYEDMARAIGQAEAAKQLDWEIAWQTVKRRLAKRGIERDPSDREIAQVLENM